MRPARDRASVRSAAIIAIGVFACGCAPEPTCGEPDRECPSQDAPYEGGRCEGSLECFYAHPAYPSDPRGSRFTCVAGAWHEEVLCDGCPPRTYEICRAPVSTPIESASLAIELAAQPIVLGSQGAAMIEHTIEVTAPGVETTRCVSVREQSVLDGVPAPSETSVLLRCGRSLPMYAILPSLPCDPGLHTIALEVEVIGAGSASASFTLDGADCPPLPGPGH